MKGYIYILKNPSFPDYAKIGYADDVEERVKQLNASECTPFAFRVYATYEVNSRLMDKKMHSIIDRLNPTLRSIDEYHGQKRIREFYAMSPEDAYSIFEAMAEIHDCLDKLKKWEVSEESRREESIAEDIAETGYYKKERTKNFAFSELNLPIGAVLQNINNPEIKCTVVDDRRIEYNGEIMHITPCMKKISGISYLTTGPRYMCLNFTYNGVLLDELEKK